MKKGGRDHFEGFEDHTRLKHMILEKYLRAWVEKLPRFLDRSTQLWFVDAFAGEGCDELGNPGSPLIASRIAEEVAARTPSHKPPLRILAIEIGPKRFGILTTNMQPFTSRRPRIASVRRGTLTSVLDPLVEHVGNAPVLYFLDPFGVGGLIGSDLPKMLAGPHNEVLALYSNLGAKRLHAALMTEERDVEYEVGQITSSPSLFPDLDQEAATRKRAEVARSTQALRATQAAAERILTEALGSEAIQEIARTPVEEQPAKLTQIFMRRLREAGAKYVISFPVRDVNNAPVYQLVHASKSKQGLRTMKEAMQAALNGSNLPEAVRAAIHYELEGNEQQLVSDICRHFAGTDVRWTQENDRGTATVRRYLLEETPAFPVQFGRIKDELIACGYRCTMRPLTFRFPDLP